VFAFQRSPQRFRSPSIRECVRRRQPSTPRSGAWYLARA